MNWIERIFDLVYMVFIGVVLFLCFRESFEFGLISCVVIIVSNIREGINELRKLKKV